MSARTVDARGLLCPKPLIMTKKVLQELLPGEQVTILVDNETSKENVCRFLQDNGAEAAWSEAGGVFTIRVTKTTDAMQEAEVDEYCRVPAAKPHVIAVKNDKMGFGSEELGQILIQAFVNTIQEASPLPGAIVFYNNGVHLATEGSPLIDSLKELEARGVKILVCGTCLDYYGKKEQLRVGRVSNMYDIVQALTTAGHVVVP